MAHVRKPRSKQPEINKQAGSNNKQSEQQPKTALTPGLMLYPPCPPELANPVLRPPVTR